MATGSLGAMHAGLNSCILGFMAAPWLKRISLVDGALTRLPLEGALVLDEKTGDRFERDGDAWFLVTHRAHTQGRAFDDDGVELELAPDTRPPIVERRWAMHGTTARTNDALFSFMEFPEARHAELEAALVAGAPALAVYADWLEEQQDPYAGALRPELLLPRGPAGNWFLEGLDRSGAIGFRLDGALVREALLGEVTSSDFAEAVHRLCHLRACLALEHLSMARRADVPRHWAPGRGREAAFWKTVQLPPALRRLTIAADEDECAALEAFHRARCPDLVVKSLR